MNRSLLILACMQISACTYGPNSGVYRSNTYNYPPVGYVLQAQPAGQLVCGPGYQAQYQTFWTYDQQGRFNPTQQYVCARTDPQLNPAAPRAGVPH